MKNSRKKPKPKSKPKPKPKSKQPKVDRISNFPDEILCHILSFLNTKQAVAMSILSKRWQFLWTYVDTLDLDLNLITNLKFEEVSRILQRHRGLIKSLSIVCGTRETTLESKQRVTVAVQLHLALRTRMLLDLYKIGCSTHTDKWIRTAISKEVQTLHLCFGDIYHQWPLCLFQYQTLVELKLEYGDITSINFLTAPFFPKLKKLHLYQPYFTIDSLNRFISGCSILEYFNLDCDDRNRYKYVKDPGDTCYISSSTLKVVSFESSSIDKPKILLNTPALEVLKFKDTRNKEHIIQSSLPSLHEADISIPFPELDDNSSSDSSLKFLEFLSNVSALRYEVPDYCYPRRSMIKLNLHALFDNLTRLEIVGRLFDLELLTIFMEKSNNLKAITLEKTSSTKRSGVIWEEPQHVPKCLLSSLESVSIYGFGRSHKNGEEVDLVIKYILGNAKVLKGLEICKKCNKRYYVNDSKFKFHMLQKISMFPKASVICEISVN